MNKLKNGCFLEVFKTLFFPFLPSLFLLLFTTPLTGQEEITIASTPSVNMEGGIYNNPISISLQVDNGIIYYTLDGSEPTTSSTPYTTPITITGNTPLRTRTFAPPLDPSPIITHTYLFNISHTFPIVAYTADPNELFDTLTGIYPNYLEDIEINVNIEFYENDGRLAFNQLVESEVSGTGSAELPQKSLAIKAKSKLGNKVIPYQLFPDLPYTELRSLVFRNSGQDWNYTMFRDAFATSLVADVEDIGDIMKKPDLCTQGFRPSVLYINGTYWGIHNVRERMDRRYLSVHFDLDEDEIDLLDNELEIKEGSMEDWKALTTFLENNQLQSTTNFEYVANKIDLDHYIDYLVFNLYIDNHDWPSNNNRRWRAIEEDSQWRWMVKDLDFSFGFYVNDQFNTGEFTANSLSRLFLLNGYEWPNAEWATLPFRRLIENPQWQTDFVNRMADQLNVLYTPERVNNRINEFTNLYAPEIQQHHDLWTSGYQIWEQHVQKMKNFADGRPDVVREFFISELPVVTATSDVQVFIFPASGGTATISTITVDATNNAWEGTYFQGVAVPLKAFPNRGYIFNAWEGDISATIPAVDINFEKPINRIAARFQKGSTSTQSIIINEINYNSTDDQAAGDWIELYNPNTDSVNIEGWYLEDESGQFFSLPKGTIVPGNGYTVLVESEKLFTDIYPNITNYIGEFGEGPNRFSLSGGGELLTLKNANGLLIDEVEYDDKAPWPTAADGEGATLQLTDPTLDNSLAASWQGLVATPNELNGSNGGSSINETPTPETETETETGTETETEIETETETETENPTEEVPPENCGFFIVSTSNSLSISGLTAPHSIVKVYDQSYDLIYTCIDTCQETELVEDLGTGSYHLDVQLFDITWQSLCRLEEDFEIVSDSSTPSCSDVQITTNNSSMQINGLTAPIEIVQIYEEDWSKPKIFTCVNNCEDSQEISNLSPQTYHVNVQFFTSAWESICSETIDVPYRDFNESTSEGRSREQFSASFQVFPNPVKDRFLLQVETYEKQPVQIALFNQLGQSCYQEMLPVEGGYLYPIDVEDMASGIYFLRVQDAQGGLFLEKIVVE